MANERVQLELLRRFEPILRFNRGERFFPMDVGTFVARASLWVRSGGRSARCLAPAGDLTLDRLGKFHAGDERDVLFLRGGAPMTAAEVAKHSLRERRRSPDPRDTFRAGRGRLARVGYTSRVVDALFSLSLLARGRVPGDLATSALVTYREAIREDERYRYYGRVLERGPWTALQYWYFYAFNDWRSQFFGTNDHEGDWEMVSVFLDTAASGGPRPEWIVCSCHEYPGTHLRRHWDTVETRGDHPVVYAGAGSHAGYCRAGDYLAKIELPAMRPLIGPARAARSFWRDTLHQYLPYEEEPPREGADPSFGVPFVDYARGDGHGIGDGEDREWSEPGLLRAEDPWVRYRGLWGYFANDPLAGEDAPPGPMYARDGSVRLSWQDPVAWCGLLSVPPRSRRDAIVTTLRDRIESERLEHEKTVESLRGDLQRIGVEEAAVRGKPHLRGRARALDEDEDRLASRLIEAEKAMAENVAVAEALQERPAAAAPATPAGLRPLPEDRLRAGKLAEVWAALSVGFLLVGLVLLATFARRHLASGAAALLVWYVVIEALFRNRLTALVTVVAVGLALVSAAVLIVEFYGPLAIALAFIIGVFLLWENIRELWT